MKTNDQSKSNNKTLKTSFLVQNNQPLEKQTDKIIESLSGEDVKLTFNQKEELKRILIDKGLTLDFILSKYKEITGFKLKYVRASDILKALERLEHFHGIEDPKTQIETKVSLILQSKSPEQMKTYLMQITQKTKEYTEKLVVVDNQADSS